MRDGDEGGLPYQRSVGKIHKGPGGFRTGSAVARGSGLTPAPEEGYRTFTEEECEAAALLATNWP